MMNHIVPAFLFLKYTMLTTAWHWSTFALATILAAENNPDRFTWQIYDVMFDRSPGLSLQQATMMVHTPRAESAIMSRLQNIPELTNKVRKYDSTMVTQRVFPPVQAPSLTDANIELLRDTGKRRPHVFPGNDVASRSMLNKIGLRV